MVNTGRRANIQYVHELSGPVWTADTVLFHPGVEAGWWAFTICVVGFVLSNFTMVRSSVLCSVVCWFAFGCLLCKFGADCYDVSLGAWCAIMFDNMCVVLCLLCGIVFSSLWLFLGDFCLIL